MTTPKSETKLSECEKRYLREALAVLEPLHALAMLGSITEQGVRVETKGADPHGSGRLKACQLAALITAGTAALNGEKE